MKSNPIHTGLCVLLGLMCATSLRAQTFQNLDFKQECDDTETGLCHWNVSWSSGGTIAPHKSGGHRSLMVENKSGVGFVEQEVLVSGDSEFRIIHFSGKIQTDQVEGKGAGLNFGVYDQHDQLIYTKDLGYSAANWASGTSAWQEYSLDAICPPEGVKMKVGAILYGSGRALFSDFKVKVSLTSDRQPSALAREYLGAVADTIALHALCRDSLSMDSLLHIALTLAGDAQIPEDCYLAVSYLVQEVNACDNHSFFMSKEEVIAWEGGSEEADDEVVYPSGELKQGVGYINVPHFHGGSEKLIQLYADSLQAIIRSLSEKRVSGWVVDLRQNTGGNMEPMIAGLGPLFSDHVLGSLVDVYGRSEYWKYQNGAYGWDDEVLLTVSNPVELKKKLPIAVLIGPQTGSSGEIVVLSFIGNERTRLFGQPTWGLTTGNGGFDLPDGARLMLASTIMTDRSGKKYHGPVQPDELIEPQEGKDVGLDRALRWLADQ